jgi:hypothetical protein
MILSCRKVPKFSETPSIEYLNITLNTYFNEDLQVSADSVVVGIRVKDGNGDIGQEPNNRNDDNINYFVSLYRKTNGVFIPVVLTGVTYNGHTPLLAPVSTPGPIEGDIFYKMVFSYSFSQVQNDTLRFDVKLKDRAGNFSNTVQTKPVIIRKTP